jgi:hypothetical protein
MGAMSGYVLEWWVVVGGLYLGWKTFGLLNFQDKGPLLALVSVELDVPRYGVVRIDCTPSAVLRIHIEPYDGGAFQKDVFKERRPVIRGEGEEMGTLLCILMPTSY